MPDIVAIDEEIGKHQDEWLLFEVVETDDIDRPIRGRLLACSRSRDEIHEVVMKHRGSDLQTVYTGGLPDMVPIILN